jgi:hypothetical protein
VGLLVAAAWSLFATALEVGGDVTCPTPAEVATRLRPLLAGDAFGQAGDRVRLDREQGVLRVSVVRADGRVRGVRNVDERHDCGELAEAAAVILASWQTQPDEAVSALERAATPAAQNVLNDRASRREVRTRVPQRSGPRFEAGLGAVVGFAGGSPVTGVGLEAAAGPAAGGLGLHLRAQVASWHQLGLAGSSATDFQPADVRWRRLPLALGPGWRWFGETLALEIDLALAAAWLSVEGRGFMNNQRHDALDVGSMAGLRLGWLGAQRTWQPFVAATGAFWPRRTVAQEQSSQGSTALPRAELGVALGIAFGR